MVVAPHPEEERVAEATWHGTNGRLQAQLPFQEKCNIFRYPDTYFFRYICKTHVNIKYLYIIYIHIYIYMDI